MLGKCECKRRGDPLKSGPSSSDIVRFALVYLPWTLIALTVVSSIVFLLLTPGSGWDALDYWFPKAIHRMQDQPGSMLSDGVHPQLWIEVHRRVALIAQLFSYDTAPYVNLAILLCTLGLIGVQGVVAGATVAQLGLVIYTWLTLPVVSMCYLSLGYSEPALITLFIACFTLLSVNETHPILPLLALPVLIALAVGLKNTGLVFGACFVFSAVFSTTLRGFFAGCFTLISLLAGIFLLIVAQQYKSLPAFEFALFGLEFGFNGWGFTVADRWLVPTPRSAADIMLATSTALFSNHTFSLSVLLSALLVSRFSTRTLSTPWSNYTLRAAMLFLLSIMTLYLIQLITQYGFLHSAPNSDTSGTRFLSVSASALPSIFMSLIRFATARDSKR